MSRINRIRIVNLNYNNDSIRIDDECFDLVNENTLLSLRNGGGKSVLIQMLTAPFVHKRYRDTIDRPFASYFTSNQPTFILVEWSLDQEAGYVLTGMMVRKNQEVKEDDENRPELEMINFIHEYQFENEYDIKHLPLLIQDNQKKTLKGFHVCRQLFEQCKQNKQLKFDYYDMNQAARSRAYFCKLEEFQIYYKEWESIIKKVNLKESGLSELFKDAKDEKGLTEKWFLEAIENKLNQQQDRIKGFETLLKKYVMQYKENEGNFKRKEGILQFQQELQPMLAIERELLDSEAKVHSYEEELAELAAILEQLQRETMQAYEEKETQLTDFSHQLHRLAHEQQSLAIYELIQQQEQLKQETEQVLLLKGQLDESQHQTLKQQHIYEAAQRYEYYKQASEDVQRCESKLAVAKQSQAELLPRLNDLGYSLSLIYEQQMEREQDALEKLHWQLKDILNEQKQVKSQLEVKQEERQQSFAQVGRLEASLVQFEQQEQWISQKYEESLQRNLEGYYSSGFLENRLTSLTQEIEQAKKQKKQALEREQQLKDEQHKVHRDFEDAKETLGSLKMTIDRHREVLGELEEELKERETLSAYIAWPKDKLLDTEGMIDAFFQKRQMVEQRLRQLERELDTLQKEKQQLQSGDVIPLPETFKQRLDEEGVQYVLGIEWLKHNKRSIEENQQLIANHPFLPYSLILSQAEMNRFKQIDLQINTPFPVPIIIREHLDHSTTMEYVFGHCHVENLHFYVWFNEELLDESRLQQLLLLKDKEIKELQSRHETQTIHLKRYEDQMNLLKFQKLSVNTYEAAKQALDTSLAEQVKWQQTIRQLQQDKDRLRVEIDTTTKQIHEIQTLLHLTQEKLEALQQFSQQYEHYVQSLRSLVNIQEQLDMTRLEIDVLSQQQDDLYETFNRLKASEREKQSYLQTLKSSFQKFERYTEGEVLQKDVEDLLAEYQAIEEQLNGDIRRSEEDLLAAKKRFSSEEDQLQQLINRYHLIDQDYQAIKYDKFAYEQILIEFKRLDQQKEEVRNKLHTLDIKLATLENEEKNAYKRLKRELNETQILDKSEVLKCDFEGLMAQTNEQLRQVTQQKQQLADKLALYARELSNLVEYHVEHDSQELVIDPSYREYEEKDWQTKRGRLLRDYKQQQQVVNHIKHQISDEFNRLSHLALFEDEFFAQPLQRLNGCKHQPSSFIEQYDTMEQVFTSLMKKLDVDIEMIEKEKNNVIQLLLDYVQEIHKHLGLIDQNSSIPIRGKNIKMLRIDPPKWEENYAIYQVRMNDFVHTLTMHCLQLLKDNENIEEFIGHQVTTKQLYDQIVGTSNVKIKLYKIEEQREYQITWEQVAKNSGGEGFLSAFVILTSLLSFMRKDETDLFSSFEEGKVLVMDNPFAQTNAAHLLKPLIELAKKNNTQLICLSGLGGDSIYSRFENIYSLSLVPSGFKKGCEYIKSNHIKGNVEPHLVIPTRIYVEDGIQEALLF